MDNEDYQALLWEGAEVWNKFAQPLISLVAGHLTGLPNWVKTSMGISPPLSELSIG